MGGLSGLNGLVQPLLDCAADLRENRAGISADHPYYAYDDYEIGFDLVAHIVESILFTVWELLLVGAQDVLYPRVEQLQFGFLANRAGIIKFEQVVTLRG